MCVRARVDEEKERKKDAEGQKGRQADREIVTEKKRDRQGRQTGGEVRMHACIHSYIHAHTFFELWQGHQFLEGCHQRNHRNQAAVAAAAAEATAERRQKKVFICVCLDASDIFETYRCIHTDKRLCVPYFVL